ncbi:MAG: hypothetical protein ABFC71_04980 [Methanoregula sp.]
MKLFKWSVILLALLLAAMAMVPMVSADDQSNMVKAYFQPIDKEAKTIVNPEFVDITKDQSKTLDETAQTLAKKYDRELTQIVTVLENTTGKKIPEEQIDDFKLLLVREHIHNLYRDTTKAQSGVQEKDGIILTPVPKEIVTENGETYQNYVTATSVYNPYPLSHWSQVTHDITGGAGVDGALLPYVVNGQNNLYQIIIYVNPTRVHYELYWYDEDRSDPASDAAYDLWRIQNYGHLYDVQSFDVQNNQIIFSDIGDEGRTYASLLWGHGYLTRPYSSTATIFVSNVWNHAMDTSDRNWNMGKTFMSPSTTTVSG